uniref:Uncharacterized protein n=1 Tax=Sphenodon punctatus TaxID=8508 RepID=A0A8D0L3X0_SPHPU
MSDLVPIIPQEDLGSFTLTRAGSRFALKAFHVPQKTNMCVKLLTSQNTTERELTVLLQEVANTRRIQCEQLLPSLGIYQYQGLLGVVTEWLDNGSLHSLIHEHELYPELPFPLLMRILSDVADGLCYLHRLNPPVIHHSLKPSNVILDRQYRAKVTDYGLPCWRMQQLKSVLKNCNNRSCWDLVYFAPEILQGGNPSKGGDIYSFGMMCWESLSRQKPFEGKKTLLAVVTGVCSGLRPGIEAEFIPNHLPQRNKLLQLILLCWHQEHNFRPQITECAALLQKILGTFSKEKISSAIYNVIHAKVSIAVGVVSHTTSSNCLPPQLTTVPEQSMKSERTLTGEIGKPGSTYSQQRLIVCESKIDDLAYLSSSILISGTCCEQNCCQILACGRETILSCMTEGRLNRILDILRSQQTLSRMDYEIITTYPTLTGRARALLDTCLSLGERAAQTVVTVLSASKCSPMARGSQSPV